MDHQKINRKLGQKFWFSVDISLPYCDQSGPAAIQHDSLSTGVLKPAETKCATSWVDWNNKYERALNADDRCTSNANSVSHA